MERLSIKKSKTKSWAVVMLSFRKKSKTNSWAVVMTLIQKKRAVVMTLLKILKKNFSVDLVQQQNSKIRTVYVGLYYILNVVG